MRDLFDPMKYGNDNCCSFQLLYHAVSNGLGSYPIWFRSFLGKIVYSNFGIICSLNFSYSL